MPVGITGVVKIKNKVDKIKNLIEGFNFIRTTEVVVGITEESNATREEGITNSELLYLQENGVPSHNIPPRPVLIPAISKDGTREQIEQLMKDGIKAAIYGQVDRAKQCYEKAGMLGRDACKNYIVEGTNLIPNAPSTIERKRAKSNRKDGAIKPLIDTGSMLDSITYAVRRKK